MLPPVRSYLFSGLHYGKLYSEAHNHLARNPKFPSAAAVQALIFHQNKLKILLEDNNQTCSFLNSPCRFVGNDSDGKSKWSLRTDCALRLHESSKFKVTYSTESGKPLDPCTPRAYAPDIGSHKLSTSALSEKNKYISGLHPSGNFTACRSASLTFVQKGKERCSYRNCDVGSTFIPKLQGKFLATENFFHTSTM